MTKSLANFSRTLDWNLLKSFHEIVQSAGINRARKANNRPCPCSSLPIRARLKSWPGRC